MRVKQVSQSVETTSVWEVIIPHTGYVSIGNIIDDLDTLPRDAKLCGFADNDRFVTLTFTYTSKDVKDDYTDE